MASTAAPAAAGKVDVGKDQQGVLAAEIEVKAMRGRCGWPTSAAPAADHAEHALRER
jgi:hypothetical protein